MTVKSNVRNLNWCTGKLSISIGWVNPFYTQVNHLAQIVLASINIYSSYYYEQENKKKATLEKHLNLNLFCFSHNLIF